MIAGGGADVVLDWMPSALASREKGLALGADDYITKPFSTDEVIERVRQYMPAMAG